VLIEEMPKSVNNLRVTWEQQVDPWVLGRLILGAVLVSYHIPLRESSALHAALGGIASLLVVMIVVVWWMIGSARGAVNGSGVLPLGGFFTSLAMLLCALVPSLREALISIVRPDSSSDIAAWLSWRDPVFNLPVGWIAVISCLVLVISTLLLGVRWSLYYFASTPEPEGEVPFTIGRDGRRIDILPPTPLPQRCLGWLIWQLGFFLLLQSTYLDACSLALTMLVLGKDLFIQSALQRFQAVLGAELEPNNLRTLMSTKAYEEQGKQHTAAAIAKLQRYIQTNSGAMDRVREDTELRVRRFSDGFGHFHHPGEFTDRREQGRVCAVL